MEISTGDFPGGLAEAGVAVEGEVAEAGVAVEGEVAEAGEAAEPEAEGEDEADTVGAWGVVPWLCGCSGRGVVPCHRHH